MNLSGWVFVNDFAMAYTGDKDYYSILLTWLVTYSFNDNGYFANIQDYYGEQEWQD